MLGKLSVSLTLTLEEIAGQGWLMCNLTGRPGEDTASKSSLLCLCRSWSQGSRARGRESLVFHPSPDRREETFQRMLQGLVMDWMWKLWFLARRPGWTSRLEKLSKSRDSYMFHCYDEFISSIYTSYTPTGCLCTCCFLCLKLFSSKVSCGSSPCFKFLIKFIFIRDFHKRTI